MVKCKQGAPRVRESRGKGHLKARSKTGILSVQQVFVVNRDRDC